MKILIAEDEPMILKTLCLYLNRAGFETITAPDGKTAIEMFDTECPDLVVTDLLMPYADGMELISHIRNEKGEKTPIVVVSTVGLENSVISALKLGADDYIVKPLRLNEVVARVNRFGIN
jgi:DNA-binding response OmpR family regulator